MTNILNVWDENTESYVGIPVIQGDKPVRGVDYFSQEEINDFVAAIFAALPDGDQVKY